MSIIVGVEEVFFAKSRGGIQTFCRIDFWENADRFHGAWPHGSMVMTVKVIPFGTKDNGGDLVETSFLCQGLLTVRVFQKWNYHRAGNCNKSGCLWKGVEWDSVIPRRKCFCTALVTYLWLGNEF
jgi:hypothetical protein